MLKKLAVISWRKLHCAADAVEVAANDSDVLIEFHRIVHVAREIRAVGATLEVRRGWADEAADCADLADAVDQSTETDSAEDVRRPIRALDRTDDRAAERKS